MNLVVGNIQDYPVIYVPEKDVLFCKNTTVRYDEIKAAIYKSALDRHELGGGKLTLTKSNGIITLGCLTTTLENISSIRDNIKTIKHNNR